MRLAIADPPYLGRAVLFYGEDGNADVDDDPRYGFRKNRERGVGNDHPTARINPVYKADRHPDAHVWDDPETHRKLVQRLTADYDAWAIAMVPDSLRVYLAAAPPDAIVAVWHDTRVMPTGRHPRRRWEPVLVRRAAGRLRVNDVPNPVGDVLTAPHPSGSFAGAKPPQWTRWVLDMLGYNPDTDTVDDLFGGSGAVTAEINQGILL